MSVPACPPALCSCCAALSYREVIQVCEATQVLGKHCHLYSGLEHLQNTNLVILAYSHLGLWGWGRVIGSGWS